jgi:alkyl sulfatase BDS1-like metallo-beta-lactamase superfamily hydrolase
LASALRTIGQRTTSANVRNWTLTRALELEGTLNRDRFRVHRFPAGLVAHGDPAVFIDALRVLVLPEVAAAVSGHICFHVGDTSRGLQIRNAVGVPTDGEDADVSLTMSQQTFAQVLGRKTSLIDALAADEVRLEGDQDVAATILACFDLPTLQLVAARH